MQELISYFYKGVFKTLLNTGSIQYFRIGITTLILQSGLKSNTI